MFTADRARGTTGPRPIAVGFERFRRQHRRVGKHAALEVPGRQRSETVEGHQVVDGAQFAVLGGGRSERSLREIPGDLDQAAGIRKGNHPITGHGDRLEPLGPHHRSESTPSGMTSVVRNGREMDQPFASGADGRHPEALPFAAQPVPHASPGLPTAQTPLRLGRLEPHPVGGDHQGGRPVSGSDDHDRVVPGPLAGNGEV